MVRNWLFCYIGKELAVLFRTPKGRIIQTRKTENYHILKNGVVIVSEYGDQEFFPYDVAKYVPKKHQLTEGIFYDVLDDYCDFGAFVLMFWDHNLQVSDDKILREVEEFELVD